MVGGHSERLLPWIAAERAIRGLLLVGVAVFLFVERNANLGSLATRLARRVELDPHRGIIHDLIEKVGALDRHQLTLIAAGALAYGMLEVTEAAGLWFRKRWAEWLTVVATSLLIPLEIYELVEKPSALKAAGVVVNVLIVLYLLRVVRRR